MPRYFERKQTRQMSRSNLRRTLERLTREIDSLLPKASASEKIHAVTYSKLVTVWIRLIEARETLQ